MNLPIRERRRGGEKGGGGGTGDSALHTPYRWFWRPGTKGLNKSVRSYSGEKEREERRKEWTERKRRRETESEGCWVFLGTYTAPEGSGHSGWPWCDSHYMWAVPTLNWGNEAEKSGTHYKCTKKLWHVNIHSLIDTSLKRLHQMVSKEASQMFCEERNWLDTSVRPSSQFGNSFYQEDGPSLSLLSHSLHY